MQRFKSQAFLRYEFCCTICLNAFFKFIQKNKWKYLIFSHGFFVFLETLLLYMLISFLVEGVLSEMKILSLKHMPCACYYSFKCQKMTSFGIGLKRGRAKHKETWVAKLLGTLLRIRDYKSIKFSR